MINSRLNGKVPEGDASRVRVLPSTENVRRFVRHPTGIAFREKMTQSVEWPYDTFTVRRLRDGDVILAQNDPTEG